MISIRAEGTQQVTQRLRRLRGRGGLLRDVERQVDHAVSPVVLRRYFPQDTGRLKRSVRVTKRRGRNRVDWRVAVGGSTAPYAPYVRLRGQSGRARYAFGRLVRRRLVRGVRGIRLRSRS